MFDILSVMRCVFVCARALMCCYYYNIFFFII